VIDSLSDLPWAIDAIRRRMAEGERPGTREAA
jgi:hypothetical protein